MAKRKDATEERIVAVESALSKTEQFIEKNQMILTIVVAAIILVVLIVIGFRRYVIHPKEQRASEEMFMAERYFELDSFNLALYGDGLNMGFIDIIDDYGITGSANLARYYAGISLIHLGEYEEGLRHLKKFKSKDQIVSSMALGAIGDAYINLKKLDQGVKYYVDAANRNDNDFVTPTFLYKAAMAYEALQDYERALRMYERIQAQYPKSREARDLDRFIARAKQRSGK